MTTQQTGCRTILVHVNATSDVTAADAAVEELVADGVLAECEIVDVGYMWQTDRDSWTVMVTYR